MTREQASQLLAQFKSGELTEAKLLTALSAAPVADLGYAQVDMHRALRKGFPEVIFGEGKTPAQVVKIAERILQRDSVLLVTRVNEKHARSLKKRYPRTVYHREAGCLTIQSKSLPKRPGSIAVLCAGTSDLGIAEEAAVTADIMGNRVVKLYDVGVPPSENQTEDHRTDKGRHGKDNQCRGPLL